MSEARRAIVQAASSLVGLGLAGWGGYMGVSHEGDWNLWAAAVVLGPVVLGVLLLLPGPVDRALEVVSPYVPVLHDHDDEEC